MIKGQKAVKEIYEFNDSGSLAICVNKNKQMITNRNNDTGSWLILDNFRVKLTVNNKDEVYKFDQNYSQAISETQAKGTYPKLVTSYTNPIQ
jgi:hypothetical protein